MQDIFFQFPKHKVLYNELMKNHTSFKIGGAADIVFFAENADDINKCVSLCKQNSIPYYIVGNGTNILVKDKGFKGVIIKTTNLNQIVKKDVNTFYIGAGVSLIDLSKYFLKENLTGFEFACGIPASFGGAVYMNAGAYGPEMKDIIISTEVLKNGELVTLSNEEMKFSYRKSIVKGTDMVIIGGVVSLSKGDYTSIKEKMQYLTMQREKKQPLDMPSAGSIFRRPSGYFAGKLIQDSNMTGYTVGGAMVSKKHSGFIVNTGNSTAKDVLQLIKKIKEVVKEKFNVELEEEIITVGE